MSTIAIITARGGSTRTLRKNVANVCGLPLVAWSIIQAKNSVLIDDVYLTTDDDEIASIGEKFGAKIIRRPVMSHGTTAGVAFRDAVEKIERQGLLTPPKIDVIVSILPTSPLRTPNEFDRMVDAHHVTGKLITTACPQKETFIYKNTEPFQDRFATLDHSRTYEAYQILGDKFWNFSKFAGGAAVGSRDALMKIWTTNPDLDIDIDTKEIDQAVNWTFVPVAEWSCFDVDYPEDLELVRVLMQHFVLDQRGPEIYYNYKQNYMDKNK